MVSAKEVFAQRYLVVFLQQLLLFLILAAHEVVTAAPRAVPAAQRRLAGHHLVVDDEGAVWGWGSNGYGQLGPKAGDIWRQPRRFVTVPLMTRAVAGERHSLAVDVDGQVWGWGDNSSGQLGLGHTKPTNAPMLVQALGKIIAIGGGVHHSLALSQDGSVWAWGGNSQGQLGFGPMGAFEAVATPTRVNALGNLPMTSLVAGRTFSASLGKDGSVWTWGGGSQQVRRAEGLGAIAQLKAQADRIMALGKDGRVWTWVPSSPDSAARAERSSEEIFKEFAPDDHELVMVLSGSVTSAAGKGVANAKVLAQRIPCANTSAAGRFICVVPRDWRGTLQAAKSGQRFEAKRVNGAGSSINPIDHAAAAALRLDFVAVTPLLKISGRLSSAGRDAKVQAIAVSVPAPAPVPAGPGAAAPTAVTPAAPLQDIPGTPATAALPPPGLRISGTIYASAFGDAQGSAGGRRIANASISADGAQCTGTDEAGNYVCTVRPNWTGRIVPRKSNYRFTPSALVFGGLRQDQRNQDFTAIYAPNED